MRQYRPDSLWEVGQISVSTASLSPACTTLIDVELREQGLGGESFGLLFDEKFLAIALVITLSAETALGLLFSWCRLAASCANESPFYPVCCRPT